MALLTYKQAAAKLHVSEATLRVQALKGRLPTTKVGHRTYIESDAVKDYATRQTNVAFLKYKLQELFAEAVLKPDSVNEEDWSYMKWYIKPGVTMHQIAQHYKVSRQRVEQRIRRGLTDAGATGLDNATPTA